VSKELILIRHAQSNEKASDQQDVDRTLTTEGMQQSTKIGFYFNNEGLFPDIIITSPAIRAQQSSTIIADQLKLNTEHVHSNDELYEASVRTFLQVVKLFKEEWERVFVIGHNPTISYLAEYITNAEIGSMSSGSVARIEVPVKNWNEVDKGNCSLIQYISSPG